ncbi:MAG TPA: CDP-glycerol glycerophosphotransferase family protein [Jatrophihabitantaceae bacterium]|jgi:hypothetical protein|nr:CDP-glycerol glycerophosphotransferase family protein [Jatrophihabitantaceae bacterium]
MSSAISRRVRRAGGRLIRRWGLLPEGDPDGLGDDDALRGQSLPFRVMVYFPDTSANLYQLRQWYSPLRRLDERHRVGIVCLDSRTAATIRRESRLPVICAGRVATLEDLVSHSDVALALYVNHNVRNLHPLRFATMLHAYLGHGESDKIASASNQVKAYDFVLLAGETARDRLARALMRYDVDKHVRLVGRPQLDAANDDGGAASATRVPSTRATVVYAPTWEGAQPSMAYSSVRSHGSALLQSLLESGEFRVVYRPHPRTGANDGAFSTADRELRAAVQQRHNREPEIGHVVDTSAVWDPSHDDADILVTDISAVAGDWMTSGKPLLVTVPSSPAASVDDDSVLNAVTVIRAEDAGRTAELVRRELLGSDAERRRVWVSRAFGDLSAGVATSRFLSVCEELIALRGDELAARQARLPGGSP